MKEYVSWRKVNTYLENLIKQLAAEGKLRDCKGIFTFPRGGLILASLLSYKTGLPILMNPVDGCIIIDDICDTGITIKKYSDINKKSWAEKKYKPYFITTMYIHDDQLAEIADYECEVDYFSYIKKKEWIVYPWEEYRD